MKLLKQYRSKPKFEQHQILMVTALMILLAWGSSFAWLQTDLTDAEKLLNRRKDRLSKRIKDTGLIEGDIAAESMSITRKFDKLKAQAAEAEAEWQLLSEGLVDASSTQNLQNLRLVMSSLAEKSGLAIGFQKMVKSDDNSNELATDNRYRRPLISLDCTGSYGQLMAFLVGLQDLEYHVAPVRISLRADVPVLGNSSNRDILMQNPQPLNVKLLLAI